MNNLPAPQDEQIEPQLIPPGDAFALLSKPTVDLTEADVKTIIADMRARRIKFAQGKADRPALAKPPVDKGLEVEQRRARTESLKTDLLGSIKI